jgi:hypothetical protein
VARRRWRAVDTRVTGSWPSPLRQQTGVGLVSSVAISVS